MHRNTIDLSNKRDKFYPLDPRKDREYPLDKNFTNFNNVQYVGDSISKYDTRYTNLSEEDIFIILNKYNPIENTMNIPMQYDDSRQTSILPYKADRYKLCVISAYIPETSIYLFEWVNQVVPAVGSTYNKYTITVEYWNGTTLTSTTVPLDFIPYVLSDVGSGLQRVFEINQCIVSLNDAYLQAFANLGITSGTCYAPKFYFNKNNSIITVVADTRMNPLGGVNQFINNPLDWIQDGTTTFVRMGWNYWVGQWFDSTFPSVVIGNNIDGNESIVLSVFDTSDPAQIIQYQGIGQTYYEINQANSSTDLFSTVEKVVVTSNIQVRPQYTSITSIGSINNIQPNSMQYLNILADFPTTISSFNNGESSAPLIFTPLHHAWTDIVTQDNLNLLSYKIFVQRTSGVLTPLALFPGQLCSLKILFRLK